MWLSVCECVFKRGIDECGCQCECVSKRGIDECGCLCVSAFLSVGIKRQWTIFTQMLFNVFWYLAGTVQPKALGKHQSKPDKCDV